MILLNIRTTEAMKISAWLKELGYKHQDDYIWYGQSRTRQVVFECKNPALETMIALKYPNTESTQLI